MGLSSNGLELLSRDRPGLSSWMLVPLRGPKEEELFDVDNLRHAGTSLPAWVYSRTRRTAVTI